MKKMPQYIIDMIKAPKDEIIEDLIRLKFPSEMAQIHAKVPTEGMGLGYDYEKEEKKILSQAAKAQKTVDDYKQQLQKKSMDELIRLYKKEKEKNDREKQIRKDEKEALERLRDDERFNDFKPDYKYWATLPKWSIREAVALLLNIEPRAKFYRSYSTSRDSLEDHLKHQHTYIAKKYAEYSEALWRSAKNSYSTKIDTENKPHSYIEWADSKEHHVPSALREAVEKYNGKQVDWKSKYEEEKARADGLENQKAVGVAEILAPEKTSAVGAEIVNSKNKPTLLWLLAVALKKAYPTLFKSEDAGYSLAQKILTDSEESETRPKKEAIKQAICNARAAVEIGVAQIVVEAQDTLKTKTKK